MHLLCLLVASGLTVVYAVPVVKVTEVVTDSSLSNLARSNRPSSIPPGLFQGDIRLNRVGRSGLSPRTFWPNRVIPYKFEGIFANAGVPQSILHKAMQKIMAVTCVRFEPAQASTKDFVAITNLQNGPVSNCWSSVGKVGGRQILNLGTGCGHEPIVIHEMMHTVGFGHEHSRPDRDKYITIRDQEAIDDKWGEPSDEFAITGFPYDWNSISHYTLDDPDDPEVTANAPGVPGIGAWATGTLSPIDAAKVNAMYGCDCP